MKTVLETGRLKLREITPQDTAKYFEFFSDPETMRFYPSTRNYQETQEFIQRQLRRYAVDGYGPWAMLLKPAELLVGYCGLIHQVVDETDEVEIGYLVDRKYWRQGLATEAATACRDYAFDVLKLNRVISLIDPLNTPSIGVARKVGLNLEKQSYWQGKLMNVYSLSYSC